MPQDTGNKDYDMVYAVRLFLSVLVAVAFSSTAFADDKLLTSSDFTYQGAFGVNIPYGGYGIAYNPANNSVFVCGEYVKGEVGEYAIPSSLSQATTRTGIGNTTAIQSLVDVTEGNRSKIDYSGGTSSNVTTRGILLWGDDLIFASVGLAVTDPRTDRLTFFKTPATLVTDDFDGYYGLKTSDADWSNRMMGSGMCSIPTAYRTQLGSKALVLNQGVANISEGGSTGPALTGFDPDSLGTVNASSADYIGTGISLVHYSQNNPTLGAWTTTGSPNEYYAICDRWGGVIFPTGSRTIIVTGLHGNSNCYGLPDECGDTWDSTHGVHCYPYDLTYVWLYDVGNSDGSNTTGNTVAHNGYTSGTMYNTLTAVKLGLVNPWDVIPYSVFSLTGSLIEADVDREIISGTLDDTNHIMYLSRRDGGASPAIEAYSIDLDDTTSTNSSTFNGSCSFK